ncbi:MAG: 2TM domain-containing protein [Bacteroidota bacterium]
MESEEIYQKAARRVKAKKRFLYHLIAYACVIGILYAIMYFTSGGQLLPVIIVALSWGIGLAVHYLNTFGTEHLEMLGFNPNWEEEELEKEIERLKRKRELKELINEEQSLLDSSENLELKEIEKRSLNNDLD